MKGSSLRDQFGTGESNTDDQITNALADALSANDKVIEIRPAKRSGGMGLRRLLLLGAAAVGLAYWTQNSQKPNELVGSVKERTASRTHQAAETIEERSELASERIEAGSERAGQTVQEVGEKVAEQTEEAGEKAADETDSTASGSS